MHRKNESGKTFYFKQFHIHHDRCAMKVGTDAVLLGAWVNVAQAGSILDIGSGSGIISIMLAQRTENETRIHGVEVDEQAYQQSLDNVNESPWSNKLKMWNEAVQAFHPNRLYDRIVSNPPYFNKSQKPPENRREKSRHTETLTHHDLLINSIRLLKPTGTLEVILPYTEGLEFIQAAAKLSLFCIAKCEFRSKSGKPIERLLLRFSFKSQNREESTLNLYDDKDNWTREYLSLVSPFYLNKAMRNSEA